MACAYDAIRPDGLTLLNLAYSLSSSWSFARSTPGQTIYGFEHLMICVYEWSREKKRAAANRQRRTFENQLAIKFRD